MNNPSQLLNRARLQKSRDLPPRRSANVPVPAPLPPSAPPSAAVPAAPACQCDAVPPAPSFVPAAPASPAPDASPAPRPSGDAASPRRPQGHALYSQIMRSHDRMGTRHL